MTERVQNTLEAYRKEYCETGNPMVVWAAYRECRAHGVDVPEWIFEYLDEAASSLWQLHCKVRDGEKVKDQGAEAAESLGLKRGRGQTTPFEQFNDKVWLFYGATVDFYIRQGDKPDFAISDCAERNGVSYSTVYRAWKKYHSFLAL